MVRGAVVLVPVVGMLIAASAAEQEHRIDHGLGNAMHSVDASSGSVVDVEERDSCNNEHHSSVQQLMNPDPLTTTSSDTRGTANHYNDPNDQLPSDESKVVRWQPCFDYHENCTDLASSGDCEKNSEWMLFNCRKSCSTECFSHLSTNWFTNDTNRVKEDVQETCIDHYGKCSYWANRGECEENAVWMLPNCRKSCSTKCLLSAPIHWGRNDTLSEPEEEREACLDDNEKCPTWASEGECDNNPEWMLSNCRMSCSVCFVHINSESDFGERQTLPPDCNESEVQAVIDQSIAYMRDVVMKEDEYVPVRLRCRNKDERCSYWASDGGCEHDPDYMFRECAPACRRCEMIEYKNRCPFDPDAYGVLEPGDVNKVFEGIITNPDFAKYKPEVLSRPSTDPANVDEGESEGGPWVLSFDEFLTDEECDRLVDFGHDIGYEQSHHVGEVYPDGTYEKVVDNFRTSENAWCDDACSEDPLVRSVIDRMAAVTGIPAENSESLQLLRYEAGQYYNQHHDYIPFQRERQTGVRVMTFFLYLNNVEEGGGTKFPYLDELIVTPRKGRAVLWTNVLDSDPNEQDERTEHEALAVEHGLKYGANAWLHMHDYQGPEANGCK